MKEVTIKLPQKVTLSCDGKFVRIRHSGLFSFMNKTSGEKTIPIRQLDAIDFRAGSVANNGHIQFVVAGHRGVKQNRISSKADDFMILFYPNYTAEVREFKEFVEELMFEVYEKRA